MNSKAYLRLLDKARCTVNFSSPNPFINKRAMMMEERVEFIQSRLVKFKVKGYSKEYIRQLIA